MAVPIQPIILYDIPSPIVGKAWSPNTWKTRYCLNYKHLNYRTEWVEYPDIEPLCKEIGASHTWVRKDGTLLYTLPVIVDSYTGAVISDSLQIALYLDKTYPDTPTLFPPGTKALQVSFQNTFDRALDRMVDTIIGTVGTKLNPRSAEFFQATRSRIWGKPFEDIAPQGEERQKAFEACQKDLGKFVQYYSFEDGPYLMGKILSWSDIVVAAEFMWVKKILKEWEEMETWHDGLWGRVVESLEQYAQVK